MQILTIQGMTGEHCAVAVSTAIRSLDPCAQVAVDLASGLVRSDSALPVAQIEAAIEAAGYHPSVERTLEREFA